MSGNQLSLILLPTNKCNVACDAKTESILDMQASAQFFVELANVCARTLPVLQVRRHVVNGVNTL